MRGRIEEVVGLAAFVIDILPARLQWIFAQQPLVALQILLAGLQVRRVGPSVDAVEGALVPYIVLVGAQFVSMMRFVDSNPLLDPVRPELLLGIFAFGFRFLFVNIRTAVLVVVVIVFGYNFFYSFRYRCGT